MDHDDSSMDDMIGGVPPSINVGQMNTRFHLPKMSTTYTGAGGSLLLDTNLNNDHNFLEGVVANTNGMINNNNTELTPSLVPTLSSSNLTTSKRILPSMYWSTDEDFAGDSSKRVNLDDNESNGGAVVGGVSNGGANNNSLASLLNQLPQTPSMVGSIGDGMFRAQYNQIPGMPWYA